MGEGPCRASLVAPGSPPLSPFLVPVHHYPFLPLSTGSAARPFGVAGAYYMVTVGGFALHEAFLRRVAGVSNPRVVQFPPIGGAAAAVCGDVAAKSSTILVKNAEDGLVVVKWSAFWVHQCLLWRVVRTRTCEYAC